MTSLADAIIAEQIDLVYASLQYGANTNEMDEYGFTPLIEATIVDNIPIAQLLLSYGADVNAQDMTGNTALHWACENANLALCKLLLEHHANANATNFAGQPVLTMPFLRQQAELKKLLLSHGANLTFTQDYVNTKLLGHLFELVGTANIIDPQNHYVEVDFEGFMLEVTLAMIAESLTQFKNHFAARKLRQYLGITQAIIEVIYRAAHLIKYQQYRVNLAKHAIALDNFLQQEPLLIPVGYEGHAITFIKLGMILVKCDRREDSRLFDNVMLYQMQAPELFTPDLAKKLMFEKQSAQFVNNDLPRLLALQPVTEIKVPAQISGNCSWANVEACIPALFFLFQGNMERFENIARYKTSALNFFEQWREWNKDRTLHFCVQSFQHADAVRKATKAEILAAILFQCCMGGSVRDNERAEEILPILTLPAYQPILTNYVKAYCYEDHGVEGKRFLAWLRAKGLRY